MRAMLEAPVGAVAGDDRRGGAEKAYGWLRDAQMQRELPGHAAERREPIVGGWCFSDGVHRWPVSDCTAEAMTALLEANDIEAAHRRRRAHRRRVARRRRRASSCAGRTATAASAATSRAAAA